MRNNDELIRELSKQITIELDIAAEYLEDRNFPALQQRIEDIQELQVQIAGLVAGNMKAAEDDLRALIGTPEETP